MRPAESSLGMWQRGFAHVAVCLLAMLAAPAIGVVASPEETGSEEEQLRPAEPANDVRSMFGNRPVPLVMESLGVAMYRPENSAVSVFRTEIGTSITIEDGSENPQWSMTIQHLHSTLEDPTAKGQIDSHLTALQAAERDYRIIGSETYQTGGVSGHLGLIELTTTEGEPYMQGWLILPAGARTFLVFTILTLPESVETVLPVLESCWSTLNMRSAAEISLRRRSRIDAGREFLQSIAADDLKALAGKQIWTRIYRPADPSREQPETEIGYSLLEVARGKKGELNPARDPAQYLADEQQEGLIVRVHGRIVGDAGREIYLDSQAIYWMAWDQSEEAWSVRGVQRQRRASRGETETGLRLPQSASNPRPRLTVIRASSADYSREPYEWLVPDVYLSQPIAPLLPYLLPMDRMDPLEMATYFYNYSGETPQLSQRIDVWEPAEGQTGRWKLTTRLGSDSPPTISTYTTDRSLIRRVRADGTVIEPSTPEQIHRIWQRKGLDTGGGTQRR